MKFKFVESINDLPNKIKDLNKYMNQANYYMPDDYKTIPVDKWELNNAGNCWDYVNYEAEQFKNMGYDYETYFVQIGSDNNCHTHTFLIFKYNQKWYWFESAWEKNQGIKEFDSKEDAINYVCNLLFNEYDKDDEFEHYIFRYDTDLVKNGKMDPSDYMNKIYYNGQETSVQEITK